MRFIGFAVLLSACLLAVAGAPSLAEERVSEAQPVLTHSHNDYDQQVPLYQALASRFSSVEADIWYESGRVWVSHNGFWFRGSLKELYLDPIQKIVDERGSVYGDDRPFYLWLDVKDPDPKLRVAVEKLLSSYSMLTVFSPTGIVTKRPVVVILTGDEGSNERYMQQFPIRHACRDGGEFHATDAQAANGWLWYSLDWGDYFGWDGHGSMPEAQRQKLQAMVKAIHQKGKRVRFWDTPETAAYWGEAVAAQVDMIGTDRLEQVAMFVSRLVPPRETPSLTALRTAPALQAPASGSLITASH